MLAIKNLFSAKRSYPSSSPESKVQNPTSPQSLTILELFQSQGCSSCPLAENTLHVFLPANPNLLLLTYDVTYWDHLGWVDTFGNRAWDQRQRNYSAKWERKSVFTPQVVVNGVADGIGSSQAQLKEIVGRAKEAKMRREVSVRMGVEGNELVIVGDEKGKEECDVLLVTYNPQEQKVEISRGENRGRMLSHRNLVKKVEKIGVWKAGNERISLLAWDINVGLERVVILQAGLGGVIFAACRV